MSSVKILQYNYYKAMNIKTMPFVINVLRKSLVVPPAPMMK